MTRVGCHVSIAGGVEKAPERAQTLGCEVMQIFTRSPRGGGAAKIEAEAAAAFRLKVKECKIRAVHIHTPYFINFASANPRIKHGSASVVREELERGTLLGAQYVMTHLGSARETTPASALKMVAEGLTRALAGYRGTTKLLLENSAGAGGAIGASLTDLAHILRSLKREKALTGICLDTQHAFASGYDWGSGFAKTLERIKKEIGLARIKLIHGNDSKVPLGGKRDRHEHIGRGHIGREGFKNILRLAGRQKIDLILETEHPEVIKDIEILKKLRPAQN